MRPALKRRPADSSLYDGASAASMPRVAGLMLATLIDGPFDNDGWVFEPKFDGLRVLARCENHRITLLSRNQQSQSVQFPEIVEALSTAIRGNSIVDGEVICLDDQGRSSFRRIQQRFHVQNAREVEIRRAQDPAYICLFDILYADGFDVRGLPLHRRKRILKRIVRWSNRVRRTEIYPGTEGTRRFREACRMGSEGLIGKDRASRYEAGRSDRWVKIKCLNRQEFAIGVRPQLVVEIAFSEWTQHGRLRHPRFEGLRPDKSARECRRERPKRRSKPSRSG
jgi:ATP-dependent DNA ligase